MADKKIVVLPLREKYNKEIKAQLQKDMGVENSFAVPGVEKVIINIGAGRAKEDNTLIAELVDMVATISGQRPVVTKAKVAVSNFKIREGMPIGLMVTMRGEKMWAFLDKLINIALPRTKDFRGISPKSFDGRGNYSMGIKDQTIFPEVDTSKNIRLHGLQISIITTAKDDEAGYKLLKALGLPFRER